MNPTKRLSFDRLEQRDLPATSITAGLVSGVLRVTGTA